MKGQGGHGGRETEEVYRKIYEGEAKAASAEALRERGRQGAAPQIGTLRVISFSEEIHGERASGCFGR